MSVRTIGEAPADRGGNRLDLSLGGCSLVVEMPNQHARPETWAQLELRFAWPEQRRYETIRPVVLFGESAEHCARETGEVVRTLYRNLQRFTAKGMAGLMEPDLPPPPRQLPPAVRTMICELKAEHAGLSYHEIAQICAARLNYRPAPQTVKRVLAESPALPPKPRRFPRFHDMADEPARRRAIIVCLHVEQWRHASIADYLGTSRKTVRQTIERWKKDGLAGLYPKDRTPKVRFRKATLPAMLAIRRLQRNPRLGAFRMSTALKQKYRIRLSPRTCGRILAHHRAVQQDSHTGRVTREPKVMPFQAHAPHAYWSVDLRYLDMVPLAGMSYTITIIDNYSRAVLASAVTRSQDVTAYLCVLFAAIRNHGVPQAIVSDGGGVFRAKQVLQIYTALGIERHQIDRGQAWQNYLETQFNLMRIMADHAFETATTWDDLVDAHAQWVADFNFQEHSAHQKRPDGRRSPFQVLAWQRGTIYSEADLRQLFYTTRFRRKLDRIGYVRFRNWKIYADEGLPHAEITVWLHEGHMMLVFEDEPVAQYHVAYEPNQTNLKAIEDGRLTPSRHRIPQLRLLDISEGGWRMVYRIPCRPHRSKKSEIPIGQQQLNLELVS